MFATLLLTPASSFPLTFLNSTKSFGPFTPSGMKGESWVSIPMAAWCSGTSTSLTHRSYDVNTTKTGLWAMEILPDGRLLISTAKDQEEGNALVTIELVTPPAS